MACFELSLVGGRRELGSLTFVIARGPGAVKTEKCSSRSGQAQVVSDLPMTVQKLGRLAKVLLKRMVGVSVNVFSGMLTHRYVICLPDKL
jgi:hypothetical protein